MDHWRAQVAPGPVLTKDGLKRCAKTCGATSEEEKEYISVSEAPRQALGEGEKFLVYYR